MNCPRIRITESHAFGRIGDDPGVEGHEGVDIAVIGG